MKLNEPIEVGTINIYIHTVTKTIAKWHMPSVTDKAGSPMVDMKVIVKVFSTY
jgi:hypothetical protein